MIQVVQAPPRPWSWFACAAALGVVVVAAVWLYASVSRGRAARSRTALIRSACGRSAAATILALVPSYRSGAAAAATVFELFERAACPLRVTVAVYQENAAGDADVWEAYARQSRHHVGAPANGYEDKLRVLNYEAGDSAGPLHAAAELFRRTHGGERTVLLVQPGVLVCDAWDEYVGVPLADKVATHVPDAAGGAAHRRRLSGFGDSDVLKYVRSMLTRAPRPANTGVATFTAYEKAGRVVSVRPRVFPSPAVARLIAASASFAYCDAALFAQVTGALSSLPDLPLYACDYYLSAALHAAGGRMYSTGATLCVGGPTPAARRYRPKRWVGGDALPVPRAYAEFAGALPDRVSGRAALGLLPSSAYGLEKFGSAEELERQTRPYRRGR